MWRVSTLFAAPPVRAARAGCPRGLYKHVSGREEFRKNCQSVYMYYLWDMKQHGGESTADPFIATSLCDRLGLCTQEAGNLLFYLLDLCAKNGVIDDASAGIALSQMGSLPFFEQLIDMMLDGKGIGAALAQGTIPCSPCHRRRRSRASSKAHDPERL